MASGAKLTIRVTSARGHSTITYGTAGRYVSLPVGDVGTTMNNQTLLPTSGSKAFWEAVLPLVLANITAGSGGGS